MEWIIILAVGIFVGHVLLNPGRRQNFIKSLDVASIKPKDNKEVKDEN